MTLKKLNFCPSPCLLWAADLARQACPCHCLFACTSRPRRGSQGGTPPPPPALAPSRRVTHQLVQTYFTLSQTAPTAFPVLRLHMRPECANLRAFARLFPQIATRLTPR